MFGARAVYVHDIPHEFTIGGFEDKMKELKRNDSITSFDVGESNEFIINITKEQYDALAKCAEKRNANRPQQWSKRQFRKNLFLRGDKENHHSMINHTVAGCQLCLLYRNSGSHLDSIKQY